MTEFNPFDVRLGATIRTRREHLNITQAQLADRIGVTFQQIQKYEKGVNRVAASRLVDIAAVLDSSAGELLGERTGNDLPGAAALLKAWNAIEDDTQREAILQVAKAMRRPV
ncbi:helix-turn-helix domain-containing protein [Brevundimonas sp.]|jgi:transcriptional regulator with XRE-family HTH domain|uniref:helix-turn-helix domain-containing protein n=1 Tax=Brevundimonas sp. TaxID=1871086 RepID=UPI0037BEDAD3